MVTKATQVCRFSRIAWQCGLLVLLLLGAAPAPGVAGSIEEPAPVRSRIAPPLERERRTVLVLYPDERMLPANRLFDESFQSTLGADSSRSIECVSEFLDEVRFPAGHQERMRDLLLQKFAARPPQVIVAFAQPSIDFCRRFRAQLFPDVPVVFAERGVEPAAGLELAPPVTGVRSSVDVAGTVRLALHLHPRARHVYLVEDSTGAGSRMSAALRQDEFDAEFHRLVNDSLPPLLDALARVPEHSVVIDLTAFGSRAAGALPAHERLAVMARATRAPMYGCDDPGVGSGIVGAVATPIRVVGTATAQMVEVVLARQAPTELPAVRTLAAAPIFDWRGLRRWGIRSRQLPAGSLVQFKPPSLWQQYATLVITTSALFLLQSGLIVALVLQSRRRRRAEREAQRRREELAHMTRVATMGELTASLAHEINQPLAAILANAQAALRLLAAGSSDAQEIRDILVDIAADDQRAGEVIRRMRSLLRKGETEPSILDINDVVVDVVGLVRGEMILQNVALALDLPAVPRLVHGDKVQLQQVLLNLMMNAMDSMKEMTGGSRRVLVRTADQNGRAVQVSVEDCGAGVPADKTDQIFEPFVTTKPHGMGLGLAICRSIIQAHGGTIGTTNNASGGATFWFTLPAAEAVEA